MDTIYIRDLEVSCIIGTKPEEREIKQRVLINIVLESDLALAGKSDNLEDTVNYRTLKNQIVNMVEKSSFYLIERMAERIAGLCLQERKVKSVRVTVDKPDALTKAGSVAVEIFRDRSKR